MALSNAELVLTDKILGWLNTATPEQLREYCEECSSLDVKDRGACWTTLYELACIETHSKSHKDKKIIVEYFGIN